MLNSHLSCSTNLAANEFHRLDTLIGLRQLGCLARNRYMRA